MFGIDKDFQNLMEQVYGPLNKDKMTEIEELKAQIKVLQSKLSFLEELEKTKSPAEEAYKRVYGGYPDTSTDDYGVYYHISWKHFILGYDAAKEEEPEEQVSFVPKEIKELVKEGVKWCEEHPDKDPLDWLKPQTPEQVADGLKEAFKEAVKQGVVSKAQERGERVHKGMEELIEKMVENPPEFLKFELGQSLYDLIFDWWDEIFVNGNPSGQNIESLIDHIEHWLPKEQSASGSQNAYVECAVEGFNDCLKKIKSKLRNKQ